MSSNFPQRHAISRARFFLRRAEECSVDKRDEFEAYLEAAIVFGRTAIHRLQTEYKKHPGWKQWFESLRSDPSVNFFREQRDFILKEGPPQVGQIIGFDPITKAAELYYFDDPAAPASDTVRYHLELLRRRVAIAQEQFRI